jgi:hypothetical protein
MHYNSKRVFVKNSLLLIFSLVCIGSMLLSSNRQYGLAIIHEAFEESLSGSDDDLDGSGIDELLTKEQQQLLLCDCRFIGFRKLLGATVSVKDEKDRIACRLPAQAFDSISRNEKWYPTASGFSQKLLDGILQGDGWDGVKQLSDEKREELDRGGGVLNYMKRSVLSQMYETPDGAVFSRVLDFGEDCSDEEGSSDESDDSEADE